MSTSSTASEKSNEIPFQSILRKYEKDESLEITDPKENVHKQGYMSVVYRVVVTGHTFTGAKRKNYQKSLIVKRLPSEENQKKFRSHIAMTNESNSYNNILPALKQHSAVPLPFAECVHVDNKYIVLRDLCAEGFQPVGKNVKGLTVPQCEIVIKGLAKLHAASFIFENKDPEKFDKVKTMTKEISYEGGDSEHLGLYKNFIRNLINHFNKEPNPPENIISVLEKLEDTINSDIKEILVTPRKLSVICHGDCWADNIMFKKQELMLVDFQLMRYSSVASDLCYLLYVNLSPEDRVENQQNLLNLYLDDLRENIRKKDVNMDSDLTKDWLETEIKDFTLFGVFFGMWTAPTFYIKEKEAKLVKDTSQIGRLDIPKCADRITKIFKQYVAEITS